MPFLDFCYHKALILLPQYHAAYLEDCRRVYSAVYMHSLVFEVVQANPRTFEKCSIRHRQWPPPRLF